MDWPLLMHFAHVLFVLDYGIVLGSKLYVKRILPGGIAAQDGSLKEGDTIVRVCREHGFSLYLLSKILNSLDICALFL